MDARLLYGRIGTLRFVEPSRQSDWDSVLACHRGELQATTWHVQRSTMGAHHLKPTGTKEGRERKLACALVSESWTWVHLNPTWPFCGCFSPNLWYSGINRWKYALCKLYAFFWSEINVSYFRFTAITCLPHYGV